jgi:hypothetical protein
MENEKNFDVFDRAVKIKGQRNIDKFSRDPEKFLTEIGALDGIEEFNGIHSEIEGEISDLPEYFLRNKPQEARGSITIFIAHHGIPYEDYCTWHIQD